MEQSLFVQSRSMNENYCTDPFAVQKVRSHSEAIIFNNLVSNGMNTPNEHLSCGIIRKKEQLKCTLSVVQTALYLLIKYSKDFANRLQGTVDKGFDEVYSLIDLCLGRDEQILADFKKKAKSFRA